MTSLMQKSFLIIKPWPNRPASSRKWMQVELALRLALGGQTDSQVSSQVLVSRKKDILRQTILYFIGYNRLMDASQLAMTWVGWPNGEKLALTCVQI